MISYPSLGGCKWCGKWKLGRDREVINPKDTARKEYFVCDHCWGAFVGANPGKRCACRTCQALRAHGSRSAGVESPR